MTTPHNGHVEANGKVGVLLLLASPQLAIYVQASDKTPHISQIFMRDLKGEKCYLGGGYLSISCITPY